MASNILPAATAGALFGAALAAAGVYSPATIIGQMRLQDFHMLKVFLTATGSSTIIIALARYLKVAECKPRASSSLGWFHGYDANIMGGLLQGFGMALTGACASTVFVQMSAGIRTGWIVAAGGILGGILYSGYSRSLRSGNPTANQSPQLLTVHGRYSMKESHAILGLEMVFALVVGLAILIEPQRSDLLLHPIVGGLLMGGSQASSLLFTGNTLGVSSAYEQCGQIFWWLLSPFTKGETNHQKKPAMGALPFAAGVMAGAWALMHTIFLPVPQEAGQISAIRALLGGTMLAFGARLAGGCTSGHGISGMSTLSISSFVTVASMFAGGIGLAAVL